LCTSSSDKLTDVCQFNTGRDFYADGIDDICDPTPFADLDRDGIGDEKEELDNCSSIFNPDQSDRDRNDIGDACELYPLGLSDLEKFCR
jgi:hypothetical protein